MWAVVAQMVQCMGGTQGERRAGSWPPPLTVRVRVHVLDWLRIGGGALPVCSRLCVVGAGVCVCASI